MSSRTIRFFAVLLLAVMLTFRGIAESDVFTVHFLDVGEGDAAIIQCGGQTLMIDGGDSYSNQFVFSYLKDLSITYIDYMISTHPHDDHVYGLATALVACDVGTVYSPVTEYDGRGFHSFLSKLADRGKQISIPHRGDEFSLGGATVTFLSEPQAGWSTNDQSIIVKVSLGDIAFLFTGDAGWAAENDMLESGVDVTADVLKLGHHGSNTSTSKAFVTAVDPTYAIISVGENNGFGHPSSETTLMLQRMTISVFRTDIHGTIICTSNGESISFQMTKKKRAEPTPEPVVISLDDFNPDESNNTSGDRGIPVFDDGVEYIGNKNTHAFHHLWCQSVVEMKEKNRVEFYSRDEAIGMGYKPCGRCNP